MFRLQRQNRGAKSGERIDFKFSNFQAIQVPKGWDKLCVTIISVETGKQIAKSSKAPARNGNCQWVETWLESIWFSRDDCAKAPEECLFKFVVAMGSTRSGILGEATVNMADYLSSKASVPILLPLKKCNYGSILQVKIQCLTPRTKLRDEESKHSNSHTEEQDADHQDMESKSNGSNVGSPSSKDLGSASHPEELPSRETSFSATASHHSLNGEDNNSVGRQDSISSADSCPHINYPAEDPSRSNHSSFASRVTHKSVNDSQNQLRESPLSSARMNNASSPILNASSSKKILQAAEETIEELRAEAKMWERDARKLTLDLDVLRMEFSDQSRKQADLAMELAAAYMECDGLKKEVENLKIVLEESMLKEKSSEDSSFQSEGAIRVQKEMENEIKFQRECNDNLSMQLERSQESNIELLSVLQELEETIENQKVEIKNLSAQELKFNDMESEENRSSLLQLEQLQDSEKKLQGKSNEAKRDSGWKNHTVPEIEMEYKCKLSSKEQEIAILDAKLSEALVSRETDEMDTTFGSKEDLMREIDALKEKLQELETDCNELTNENLELLFKIKDHKSNCTSFDNSIAISESEMSDRRSHILDLQEKLKKTVIDKDWLAFLESSKIPDIVEQLRMAFYHVKKSWYNIPSHVSNDIESDLYDLVNFKNTDMNDPEGFADCIWDSIAGLNNLLEERIVQCEEVLRNGELEMKERNVYVVEAQKMVEDYILKEENLSLSIQELESSNIGLESSLEHLEKELEEKTMAFEKLEANLLSKEEEIGFLREAQEEFKSQISDLKREKIELEENMETVLRESKVTSKCLDDLRNDLMVLSSSMDSHVSLNKILETKCSELEMQKQELEHQLSNLENENMQVSQSMSELEAQLRYVTDERDSCLLEIENSKSAALSLQDEIGRFRTEMEAEKPDLREKLKDTQNQCSEAQKECENLKIQNQKFQVSAEGLLEECDKLQKENGQLRKQNLDLYENLTDLETKLRESLEKCSKYSKMVETLEANLSEMLEAFVSKEKSRTSEIDALLQENGNLKEKLDTVESLLNRTNLEKTAEIENLRIEKDQSSATCNEKERIASEAVHEVSSLQATKAKLEYDIEELKSKVKLTENELEIVRRESEVKVQGLISELSSSKKNHELLVAACEKMLISLGIRRSSEEKLPTTINDLELKLTVSEHERQLLIEETANLKVQLWKVALLQDEILGLKSEKEKMEASMRSLSRDCEELKAEKITLIQKMSILETAIAEFEESNFRKVALEEKISRVESDMLAREKDVSRANKQFESEIHQLEEEKGECLKKSQALEENLKSMEERIKVQSKSRSKQGDTKYDDQDESPHATRVDHIAKVQLLENELAQAMEANNKYKIQLHRLLSEGRSNHSDSLRKSTHEGEVVAKEIFENTKSSLERELNDLQDRYFQMSLKYAEVENQKDDLVMKLREAKTGKKLFS
ncbi:hypothetical protein RHSIM_Rhsim03G0087000 [Rhododendron simsii]|uniref:C2 NT-type domain-containing protein n=1 Tax=Rhododendron simsii TaxID=118357 RepID=A0A834H4G5_RHOSS|nr:hypothetical protein RHSIM_Rhsim03G0087000 [Rhododendron simsii]